MNVLFKLDHEIASESQWYVIQTILHVMIYLFFLQNVLIILSVSHNMGGQINTLKMLSKSDYWSSIFSNNTCT